MTATMDTTSTAASTNSDLYTSSTPSLLNPDQPEVLPYDQSAPDDMFDPYSYSSGNDVYTKTYLWLEWMQSNPENSNGPEIFLLYLSNVCAKGDAGEYDSSQFNAFATEIASIQNSSGKSLIAECVDITMEQMCLTDGYTPDSAEEQIDLLFPGNDPISIAVRKEASTQADVMNASGYQQPSQDEIQQQWYDYITDPSTNSSINQAQTDLRGSMIQSSSSIYVAIMVLLMLLDASGTVKMDGYAQLSEQLADETNQLNEIINEWNNGFETPEEAQEWMDSLQDLQNEMNQTPFDPTTMATINDEFQSIYDLPALTPTYIYQDDQGNNVTGPNSTHPGQAVDDNGYPLYEVENSKNNNSATCYYDSSTGKYYIEGSNPPQEVNADNGTTYQPLYWTNDPSAKDGLTDGSGNSVNGRSNPKSTVSGVNQVEYDNYLYIDPNNHFIYTVSPTGEAPPGVTVYTTGPNDPTFPNSEYYYDSNGNAVFLEPPLGTTQLTLGDQAYNGSSYTYIDLHFSSNGNSHSTSSKSKGTSANLLTTLDAYQPKPLDPNNPNGATGFSPEDQTITTALDQLTKPLTQQSNIVGTEMQQATSNMELYENTFSAILLDQMCGEIDAINGNIQV